MSHLAHNQYLALFFSNCLLELGLSRHSPHYTRPLPSPFGQMPHYVTHQQISGHYIQPTLSAVQGGAMP